MYSVCTGLTQLYLLVEYKVFSTESTATCFDFDNGHLQVVHEVLIKELYRYDMELGYLNLYSD